ncbi:hypothetical protein [Nocardia fusca]|uniref:Uncharacterized protein n=1 Tax=Nocardia fusca TaxID=941183 RepID=A0ABV3FD42_9NOCA
MCSARTLGPVIQVAAPSASSPASPTIRGPIAATSTEGAGTHGIALAAESLPEPAKRADALLTLAAEGLLRSGATG